MGFPFELEPYLIADERLKDKEYLSELIRLDDPEYYTSKTSLVLAEDLIGKIMVRKHSEGLMIGRITETECYMGLSDDACHAHGGKITERNSTLYMEGGTAYVHMIYGMYYCMNIVANEVGEPEGVLLRGIEPMYNIPLMTRLRYRKKQLTHENLTRAQFKTMSDGPGKMTLAMDIGKEYNRTDLKTSQEIMIFSDGEKYPFTSSPRIGVDYAVECRDKLWRFNLKKAGKTKK